MLTFYPVVMDLLDHDSAEVRIQAVQTLLSLEDPSTINTLMKVYYDQPLEVQFEILRVMKISKDPCCTNLLKKELSDNTVSGIKVNAAEALFALGHQEYLTQQAQNEESSEEFIQIIKYALREKIC
nr:HEAT repeat domain-containing protein [Chryseobacterium lactis]